MEIDIWTDIVCPFCYLGRARFEDALSQWEHRDEVTVTWHSFELDRSAPPISEDSLVDHLAGKYGMSREQATAQHESLAAQFAEAGLEFTWQQAQRGNTFDAHRLVHFAAEHGHASAAHLRLMQAYFSQGRAIGDPDTLVNIAIEIGLDGEAVRAMLESEDFGNHVRSDEATATMLGITSVPFFVLDRKYGVSGAQPSESFTQALDQAWATRHEERPEPVAAGGCSDGGCGNGACGSGACAR